MTKQHVARLVERSDIPAVVELAREHHATSRFAHIPFEGDRVYKLCQACMVMDDYGCVVLESDGELSGYVAMEVSTYMWADYRIASDMALYITPKHRSINAFISLLRGAEEWAKSKNIHTLQFSVTTPPQDVDVRRYGKVYVHAGFEWYGDNYRKEIK